jgi:hypothetical protein
VNAALQIPTVAIQYNGQQAFVYGVNPNSTVAIKNIKVTNENDNKSAIDGLPLGSTIVTSNFDRIQDGAKVATGPSPDQRRPSAPAPGQNRPSRPTAALSGASR